MRPSARILALAALLVAGLAGLLPAQEGGGGGGQSTMVLDAANNSLIIRTTPRNHRRIATLITKLAKARLEGEKQETRMFNVRNLSPEQFFKILEFQRPTFQRTSTLVVPETANGQNLTGGR